jgi:hypothetical protein
VSFFKWLCVLIRITLEAVILGFAWYHSHWSVALTLTLLTANTEIQAVADQLRRNREEEASDSRRLISRLRNIS